MTTALTEFQRLEAQGMWRETPQSAAREVIVSVGDATLILSDPKTETPLSHWSLPAVTRLNPGKLPALYAPADDSSDETLEVEDTLMIRAIERVHHAMKSRRNRPGSLRGGLVVFAVLAVMAALVFWLPDAVIRHAAHIAPPAQARKIGQEILTDLESTVGAVCKRESGMAVLDWLAPRLIGEGAEIRVLPGPISGARRLPGDLYVLGSDLLKTAPGPETAAAHLVAARLGANDDDLRLQALHYAGFRPVLRLLTLGGLSQGAMAGYGQELLRQPPPRPDDGQLLAALGTLGLPSEPYARSLDPTGQSVIGLIEGNPYPNGPAKPLLTGDQWRALQQICAG